MTARTRADYLQAADRLITDVANRRTENPDGSIYYRRAETSALDIEFAKALIAMAQAVTDDKETGQ
ncbi:hypothetical protein [Streptomyces griseomycini]|uniref:hypothetical protein n=1 Tax=Streptomyces TaxID=1883 RepID=UPI001875E3A7|nr:hypothetical protein [Streptomyces griseomycini]